MGECLCDRGWVGGWASVCVHTGWVGVCAHVCFCVCVQGGLVCVSVCCMCVCMCVYVHGWKSN